MNRNPKVLYKTAGLIHWALLIPMLFFSIFTFINNVSGSQMKNSGLDQLIYIPMLLIVVALTLGRFLYANTLSKAKGKSFYERMQAFMSAMIIRDAFFEVAGIAAAVVGFLTGNNLILLLIILIVIQFYLNRPTYLTIENDLKATRNEMEILKA
ncbi:hypothetical protein [Fulvivirga lutea]|uniref:Uncharacterized protein n=1 Tax=Fulvivirga lutea TaxID=2810512 RepID=A0A974WDN6_9BACT|nr:hypothetical protein [Fulvivirga lutea]QSE96178.1 hypothetical protein JR347_11200 [Fulvivirga lutea]